MIEIVIDQAAKQVQVENKYFNIMWDWDEVEKLIEELLNKAKYSGESITLWVSKDGQMKDFKNDW